MGGPESENDDFKFVMTCLKHTSEKLPKPNFDEVAKELGAKNATACYKRHWAILKKWGLAGNSGKGRKPAGDTTAKTTTTGQKRKAQNGDSGGDEKAPAKKGKAAPRKKTAPVKVKAEQAEEDAHEGDAEVKAAESEEDEN
ncbi:hypothetical protein CLCR_07631 [Cladophialophora carrionii]|uniref:Myb-like DNA-binding domain-containing protein n=1 Tax=Cladophialophora carrionii TaxID=86049 RepID=A0A1C1CQ88_9EURO|nr:hypothetical protein CLCR_07631 [Cladophialophora carrionii]